VQNKNQTPSKVKNINIKTMTSRSDAAEDAVLHAMINKNTSSLDAALACLSEIPDRVVQMSQNTHILGDFAMIATAAVQLRGETLMKVATANALSPNFMMERAIFSGTNDVIKRLVDMKADVALAVTQAIEYNNAHALQTLDPTPTEAMFDAAAENKEVTSVLVRAAMQAAPAAPAVKLSGFVCKSPANVQVGDYVDALDTMDVWLLAKVIESSAENVRIHYIGYDSKYDEVFSRKSARLAVAGSMLRTH
jgi:hypothetical protein